MTEGRSSPLFTLLILVIIGVIIIGGAAIVVISLVLPVRTSTGVSEESMTFSGIATYVDLEGGSWGFVADDGTRYLPVNLPVDAALHEGQRVVATVVLVDVATIQMWGTPVRVISLSAQVPQDAALSPTLWVLDAMRDGPSLAPLPAGSRVTLTLLADGTFQGRGPVNLYFGEYSLAGQALTFGAIGATEMAGSPELMDREARYFFNLGEVQSFAIREGVLTLTDSEGTSLLLFHAEGVPA
ncbi:MAG: META domain-containing protein [Methanoregulaceae archaeon]|jgi:heat shock protein HslJ